MVMPSDSVVLLRQFPARGGDIGPDCNAYLAASPVMKRNLAITAARAGRAGRPPRTRGATRELLSVMICHCGGVCPQRQDPGTHRT